MARSELFRAQLGLGEEAGESAERCQAQAERMRSGHGASPEAWGRMRSQVLKTGEEWAG